MSSESAALAGMRGLVAEDEFLIALDLEEALQSAGAQILTASRVEKALEVVRQTEDLAFAVLDVHLGHETSLPIAAALTERKIPFVFLSGLGKADAHLRQFPNALVMGKPYQSSTLIAMIVRALAER